jgi:acyl-CoA thioesterase FadM
LLLLLRTFTVIFLALFSRRRGTFEESRLRLRVWPNDCDLNFHLNDGRYVSLAGLGRIDLLARSGLLRIARKRGWFPVVGSATIRYRKSLLPFERFTLRSRLVAWDAKWFYIEHLFERRDGSIGARLIVRTVLRTESGPVPTADVLAAAGHADEVSPPLPAEIAKWVEVEL